MIEIYDFSWNILTILCGEISGYRLKPYKKHLSYTVKMLFTVSIAHWLSANFYFALKRRLSTVDEIAYILMPIQLVLVWYFLKVQKENLCIITQKMHDYRISFKVKCNHSHFVKYFVISLILLPCVIFLIRTLYDCDVRNVVIWI